MKSISSLFTLLLVALLFSCSSDVEPPPPTQPGPGPNDKKLLEIEKEFYQNPGTDFKSTIREVYTVDSTEKSITVWVDNPLGTDGFIKHYFDNAWRLTKVINHRTPDESKDTLIIQRPSLNVFEILFPDKKIRRYTISPQPDGSRVVSAIITTGSTLPQSKWIIDGRGRIVYSASSYWGIYHNSQSVHHFTYTPGSNIFSVKDTSIDNSVGTTVRAFNHTIARTNIYNPALVNFMKKMAGTDMEWILDDDANPIETFRFSIEFSNMLFLQQGALLYDEFAVRESTDGINFKQLDPWVLGYSSTYDNGNRLTNMRFLQNQKLSQEFRIHYPD